MSNNRQELVDFYGDRITAIQEPSGDIYVVAREILKNIGFDDYKIDNQRKAWNKDIVISKGSKILLTLTNSRGMQQTSCINRKYIPLALAKISITPSMQRDQPEIVEKLIRYQEECADVLFKHFYKCSNETNNTVVKKTDEDPITREELAMYFKYMTDMFTEYINVLDRRDAEREKYFSIATELLNNSINNKVKPSCEKSVHTSPLLQNTLGDEEIASWTNRVWDNARIISKRNGKPPLKIFTEVYNILREEINLDSIYKEYVVINGKATKIAMCANSDYLRECVDNAFNMLTRKYFPEICGGHIS